MELLTGATLGEFTRKRKRSEFLDMTQSDETKSDGRGTIVTPFTPEQKSLLVLLFVIAVMLLFLFR